MFRQLSSLGILLILLLTACGASTAGDRLAQNFNATATQAALNVETEIARPSSTPTPSATATPLLPTLTASPSPTARPAVIRITALPGLEMYTHPEISDYVFQIDAKRWIKDPKGDTANLVDQAVPGCSIESVPGSGIARPVRALWQDFGRFRWQILDYGAWAFAVPVLGSGLSDQGNSFLRLSGYNLSTCRSDQEQVLANLITRGEADGDIALVAFSSPTPRPALPGFTCPNTPAAHLRVGDEVSVITDGLWLRSEPRADDGSKLRKYNRYPGVMIKVIGGPVCEKYIYWQVEISQFGEASEAIQGWFAEGDTTTYYLMPVK